MNEGIHHYKLGLVLKERLDAVGVPCIVRRYGEYQETSYEEPKEIYAREAISFLKQNLKI